jgi:hypothetical protein
VDILLNRLFIEPTLGMAYPREDFKFLEKLELFNKSWKYTERLKFNFDFIGLQNYFPVVIKYNSRIPTCRQIPGSIPHGSRMGDKPREFSTYSEAFLGVCRSERNYCY